MYQLTKDLFRIPMKAEEVLCSTVYESEALKEFTEEPVKSPKIEEVYGHLKFPRRRQTALTSTRPLSPP